jgi:hypothetical protein
MWEVEEEAMQFVSMLKDWPLSLLEREGRVLLRMYACEAGPYYDKEQLSFILPKDARRHNPRSFNRNNELPLPTHQLR